MAVFTDRCWVEVDLDRICENYRILRQTIPADVTLMAMAKGAAYGTGMLPAVRALQQREGCRCFATASFQEAHELRQDGIDGTVFVLGPIDSAEVSRAVAEDIAVTVNSFETAQRYADVLREGETLRVHIKIDTGMGRIGLRAFEDPQRAVNDIVRIAAFPQLRIEGAFTHLCDAYDPAGREYTERQLEVFRTVTAGAEAAGVRLPLKHCANSAGALEYPAAHMDMVRIGASLYGMFGGHRDQLPVKPAFSFRTRVIQITDHPAGVYLGYNRAYCTPRPMTVATVSVGNADGYYRYRSNRGVMLYKGQRVPVLGMVAMDMVLLDISAVPNPAYGDVVTIIGEDGGTCLSAAESGCYPPDTLEHEYYNSIPPRVPRYYLEGGRVKYRLRYQPRFETLEET